MNKYKLLKESLILVNNIDKNNTSEIVKNNIRVTVNFPIVYVSSLYVNLRVQQYKDETCIEGIIRDILMNNNFYYDVDISLIYNKLFSESGEIIDDYKEFNDFVDLTEEEIFYLKLKYGGIFE